jgi:hypothetical protein
MPRRIPIKAAKEFARAYGLRQVILCAWDGERTHVVTYGASVEDCDRAAQGGDRIKAALGWPETLNTVPSRVAALQARVDQLLARPIDTELVKLLGACVHALRSYEFGNGSPDLAKEIADEAVIALRSREARA